MSIYNDIKTCEYNNLDELYTFLKNKHEKNLIKFVMYDLFNYTKIKKNNIVKRLDQDTFKKQLIKRYKKCIISGSDPIVCEACHIIPFCDANESDKYNVNNGLLLRSDLHILFDKKLLKINPNTLCLEFDINILNNENMNVYKEYQGKKIYVHECSIPFL